MTEKTVAPELDDEFIVRPPEISHLITEDDTPVDNIFSERQMALLREALYTSWAGPGDDRTFVAMGNVAKLQERQRAEVLAAKLRELGIDPDAVLGERFVANL